jgi:predicted ester cyclase
MAADIHQENKQLIARLGAALYDCDGAALKSQLAEVLSPHCEIHLAWPFEDLDGPDALYDRVYRPLLAAIPDLERRDFIVMAGPAGDDYWVGCAGHYMGVYLYPWLDIPPTGHPVAMRYHEFFRVVDRQVVEIQALWDIPQVMMQAGAWPMTPSLGVEWVVPGPATQDGIMSGPRHGVRGDACVRLVREMLAAMGKHPQQGGPEIMELERFWHYKMNWYGPAGIGTVRRITGFRNWHQIPFLKAMPDRGGSGYSTGAMFGDGDYVGTTGWPNMRMTLTGDGWLGIAPADQPLTMRSLDFWRCEGDRIRENWVLVDLLHVYHQLDVDVFSRLRELTHARQRQR